MDEATKKWEIEKLERGMAKSGIAESFIVVFREISDEEHCYTREDLAQYMVESTYKKDTNRPTWTRLTIRQNDRDFARIHRIDLSLSVFFWLSPLS